MSQKVQVTLDVDKDAVEILDVIDSVVGHLMQKKPLAELLGELPDVVKAVDGWENAVAAVKGTGMSEVAGYGVHKILTHFEKDDAAE